MRITTVQQTYQYGLGYEKENIFHILGFSKLVKFASLIFFDEKLMDSTINEEVVQIVDDKNMEETSQWMRTLW